MTHEPYFQSLEDLTAQLRKLTEGKTPEEIEAWKADIDRARHPQDYFDVSPMTTDKANIVGGKDETAARCGHETATQIDKLM